MKKLSLLLMALMIAGTTFACDGGGKDKKACCKKGEKKECCKKGEKKGCDKDSKEAQSDKDAKKAS